jgi:autophagy-related protein 5
VDPTTISPYDGYFTYDDVPLKWHLPLGLLYDIYALSSLDPDSSTPAPLPFKLVLHFSQPSTSPTHVPGSPSTSVKPTLSFISPTPPVLHDAFINAVKEADYLRTNTAKPIMSLSAADSKALWTSIQNHDQATYCRIQSSLLPPPGQFRNSPLRVYLPSGPEGKEASIKVLQAHVPPTIAASSSTPTLGGRIGSTATGQPQTLGTALHTLLPNLFPSRRTPVLARPVLHGAVVPMGSHLEELNRCAAYADGWLGIVVVMNT